jgi:hypothetical protein
MHYERTARFRRVNVDDANSVVCLAGKNRTRG